MSQEEVTMKHRRARSPRGAVLQVVMASALAGISSCAAPSAPDTETFQTFSYYDDGLRILLTPHEVDPVVGADVRWIGSDLYITFVRDPHGEVAAVSHPAYVHSNGQRYVYIPFEHVAAGTWVNEFVDVGGGPHKLGAIEWQAHQAFADQVGGR